MNRQDMFRKALVNNPSKLSLLSFTKRDELSLIDGENTNNNKDLEEDTFEDERRRYAEHIEYLDNEVETLKEILQNWIDELERTNK